MASRIVTLKEISENIFHLEFSTPHLMCSTLIRFQEYYECPKYKNKVFTLEEYMDWYADKFGDFTYFTEVAGFNMPSSVLDKFYAGKFDPLTRKEQWILKLFKKLSRNPFYIIATCKNSIDHENDLIHEISHGLYYVNREYRNGVRKILAGADLSGIYEWLRKRGYHKDHLFDEAHAILLEDAKSFGRCGQQASQYREVRRKLRANYDEHFVWLINRTQKVKI